MNAMIWIVTGALIGAGIAIGAMFATSRGRKQALEDAFRAIGAEALRTNSDSFLQLANLDFAKGQTQLKGLLDPMKTLLEDHGKTATEHDKNRAVAFTAMESQIKNLMAGNTLLSDQTNQLVNALKRPDTRGRWGEMQLRNIVELAGMTERCDFEEQVSVTTEEGRLRPDMTVRLPGGGTVVIDSKVPLESYLKALEAGSEAERVVLLKQHVAAVEGHVRALSSKAYKEMFDRQPRFVVMFLPVESAYVAALETKPDLFADAIAKEVLIATPTNLMALLTTIGTGWRQEDVAKNAREIEQAGATLYKRLGTLVGHLAKLGDRIKQSTESYNQALGSLDQNVLPAARRLKDMNATSEAEIEAPSKIEIAPRVLQREELSLPAADE
jgi:DNA recombination protein RmuC